VLAWLRDEPGATIVDPLLAGGIVSAPNWSETWQKLHQHGVDADRATRRLRVLGVRVAPLTADGAVAAARLRDHTRSAGLSLGDAGPVPEHGGVGQEAEPGTAQVTDVVEGLAHVERLRVERGWRRAPG